MTNLDIYPISMMAFAFLILSFEMTFESPFHEWFWYLIAFPLIIALGIVEYYILDRITD